MHATQALNHATQAVNTRVWIRPSKHGNLKVALNLFYKTMDHSPIRQTFELGKFISTAGKSIINLVKL